MGLLGVMLRVWKKSTAMRYFSLESRSINFQFGICIVIVLELPLSVLSSIYTTNILLGCSRFDNSGTTVKSSEHEITLQDVYGVVEANVWSSIYVWRSNTKIYICNWVLNSVSVTQASEKLRGSTFTTGVTLMGRRKRYFLWNAYHCKSWYIINMIT